MRRMAARTWTLVIDQALAEPWADSARRFSSLRAKVSRSLTCFLEADDRMAWAMMQVTAMPRPIAVLLSASEIPLARRADRSSGLAADTAPNARMRPTTVP